MDKYGNKFFENLEEELPCELGTVAWPFKLHTDLDYSENAMGGL